MSARRTAALDSIHLIQDFLTLGYGMTPDCWWENARKAFGQIKSQLERKPDTPLREDLDFSVMSAPGTCVDAHPVITILEAGTHTLGLTARNEILLCQAFGTIKPEHFKCLFWEMFVKQEENTMIVYEAVDPPGHYSFRFEGYNFQIQYFQLEDLVRAHPDILSTPLDLIQSQFHCSPDSYNIIWMLQEERKNAHLFNDPGIRATYFYFRAWSITQGRYMHPSFDTGSLEGLTPRNIAQLLVAIQAQRHGSVYETEFFREQYKKFGLFDLHKEVVNRGSLFGAILSQGFKSLHEKMDCNHYASIWFWHEGSDLERSRWLSMVECRLPKLKARLENVISQSSVSIWPQRMTDGQTQGAPLYEAYYILGVKAVSDISPEIQGLILTELQEWDVQITSEGNDKGGRGLIQTNFVTPQAIEGIPHKPCRMELEREPIFPPDEQLRFYEDLFKNMTVN